MDIGTVEMLEDIVKYMPPSLRGLESEWWIERQYWYVINETDTGDLLEYVVLHLIIVPAERYLTIHVPEFLRRVRAEILQPWNVTLNDVNITFVPSFNDVCEFTWVTERNVTRINKSYKEYIYYPVWYMRLPAEDKESFSRVTYLSNSGRSYDGSFDWILTKLFFCEQIEYFPEDISYDSGDFMIVNYDRRILHKQQFTKLKYYEAWKYRVCVEDTAYMRVIPERDTSTASTIHLCFGRLWILVIFHRLLCFDKVYMF